ncbi:hypothetical protein CABS03_15154 [Colletotrichum abscissum]|uniref:Uncharacterized protein n=1 Tax=Colletotrichum abscissum TaxID=1671311 RepID=A0A9P9X146_9PEZI|nr:hypothetical protein CABS02_14437 [Colletotrichum abscissum]
MAFRYDMSDVQMVIVEAESPWPSKRLIRCLEGFNAPQNVDGLEKLWLSNTSSTFGHHYFEPKTWGDPASEEKAYIEDHFGGWRQDEAGRAPPGQASRHPDDDNARRGELASTSYSMYTDCCWSMFDFGSAGGSTDTISVDATGDGETLHSLDVVSEWVSSMSPHMESTPHIRPLKDVSPCAGLEGTIKAISTPRHPQQPTFVSSIYVGGSPCFTRRIP